MSNTVKAWQFKIVLIGDTGVGKTSIHRQYMGKKFRSAHIATIGVDFSKCVLTMEAGKVSLMIWDLAGEYSYETVRRHYYSGCHSIILVYSVVDRASFDNTSKWLIETLKYMDKLPPVLVLANKIDIRPDHSPSDTVLQEEGERFARVLAKRLDVPTLFKETSALTGENVDDAFRELAELMIEYHT